MTREAEEARTIQQALLPRTSPLIPGFVVSGLSLPAGAVGGDWYDFIPLPEGRWGLVLADVSGKGTAAALLMSATRGMLRSLAPPGFGSRRGAHAAQRTCCSKTSRTDASSPWSMPSWIRSSTRCAWRMPATSLRLLVDHAEPSGHRWIQSEQGLPLGIAPSKYSETEIKLNPGARVAFYSDGITEAEVDAGGEYGAGRLLAQVQLPDFSPRRLP